MKQEHALTVLTGGGAWSSQVKETFAAPFDELMGLLKNPPTEDLAVVWGAKFLDGRRANKTCLGRSILAIDIDGDLGHLSVAAACERSIGLNVRAGVHTTKSSTRTEPRIRVLVELGEPSGPREWGHVWMWVKAHWPEHDPSGKDIARFSWAPRPAPGYEWGEVDGPPLSVGEPSGPLYVGEPSGPVPFPLPGTIYPTPSPRATADLIRHLVAVWPATNRHYCHMGVAGLLARWGFPHAWVSDVVSRICGATGAADKVWMRQRMVDSTFEKTLINAPVAGFDILRQAAPKVLSVLDAFVSKYSGSLLGRISGT